MIIKFKGQIESVKLSDKSFKAGLANYPVVTGESDEYLDKYFDAQELSEIPLGESVIIHSPVGSGKTTAIINAINNSTSEGNIFILTNRKASKIQIKRDVLKSQMISVEGWNDSAVLNACTGKVKVLTYQELAQYEGKYLFKKGTLLIMDEIHYLTSDATFSTAPSRIVEIIEANRDNTVRVYISATMDDVIGTICQIEYDNLLSVDKTLNTETGEQEIVEIPSLRIHKLYNMKSCWSHISLRFYKYADIDKLSEVLNNDIAANKKSVVFTRSIARGKQFEEALNDSSLVFSSDADNGVLSDIALNERFENSNLIATKVLENGVSITDNSISNIVIEETDPVTFMQFLGRVRTNRRNPRPLTVWIPDYTMSELKHFKSQYCSRLNVIKKVIDNPEYCMRNASNYLPYVCYSESGPEANMLAYKKYKYMHAYMEHLTENESKAPHSYIRDVVKRLGLTDEIQDCQFIDYDDILAFKSGVSEAYNTFVQSEMLKSDRDKLAKDLIAVVNSTNHYGRKITSNQLQIDKINEILACAGINAGLHSRGEVFAVN